MIKLELLELHFQTEQGYDSICCHIPLYFLFAKLWNLRYTYVTVKESVGISTTETTSELSKLEAFGSVKVEKELFDVVLTIPKDLTEE